MKSLAEIPQTDWLALGYTIRRMRGEDIPQVKDIERESFPTLWPSTSFRKELHNKLAYYIVAQVTEDEPFSRWESYPSSLKQNESVELVSKEGRWLGQWTSGFKKLFYRRPYPRGSAKPILGFAGIWFMVDEAHLVSIAVRNAYRRQGIGELLLIKSIELARERKAKFVTLEVRASNLAAQTLYGKYGFQRVGVRKRYYTDNGEDALIMTTDAIDTPSFEERFERLQEAYFQRHCKNSPRF